MALSKRRWKNPLKNDTISIVGTYRVTLKFNKSSAMKKYIEAKDRPALDKIIESNKFLNSNKDRLTIQLKYK